MISVDGFDDPLHDEAGAGQAPGHDVLDHELLDHDAPDQDALDQDALDHRALDQESLDQFAANGAPFGAYDAPCPGEELTATGPDGERVDLGPADVSSTGDPEHLDSTTAVSADGTSIGVYTDLDGDGTVDQIIDVHPDGSYALYLQDHDDDWQVGQTGHITAEGEVVADQTPAAEPGAAEPAVFAEGAAEPNGDPHPAAGGGPTVNIPAGAHVDGAGFAGRAEQDATGDGTNDTVVLHGADGSVTTATDYDGDGVADQVTVVSPDGTVTVSAAGDDGEWHPVATGEVTPDGGIVFHEPVAEAAAQPATSAVGDLIVAGPDGSRHDLGVPDQDLDGDGVPDSVAARTQDGHLLIV